MTSTISFEGAAYPLYQIERRNTVDRFFNRTDPLTTRLKYMANDKNFAWNLNQQQAVIQALKSQNYHECKKPLKIICHRLSNSNLHQLIKSTASIDIKFPILPTVNVPLERLASLLTLEQIEAALHTEFPNFQSALEKAKELSTAAKYYIDLIHPPNIKFSLNSILTNLIGFIDSLIDTILTTFGLNEFRDDDNSEYKANYRLQLLLSAFSTLSAFVTIAISLSKSAALGLTIVGTTILVGGALLALYLRYIKPAPRKIKGCRNLTTEAISGRLSEVNGRQHYIDEIAKSLMASSSGTKTHPLLIGPSGVGKTEIIQGFARAMAEGRYPSLFGKQIFYINTADLIPTVNRTTGVDALPTLEKIKDRIRYRRNDVILIFDEFHESCKGEKNRGNLAERLKTLLDNGPESFPYVIAATTINEFDEYIKPNDALARRFKHISIKEASKIQTLAILKKKLLSAPGIYSTEDAIDDIYELSCKNFPGRPQPYMSCRILAQAILKVKETGASKVQLQIEEEQAAIEAFLSSRLLGRGADFLHRKNDDEANKDYNHRLNRLDYLKQQLEEEHSYSKIIESMIKALEQSKENVLELSVKIQQNPKANPHRLKEFVMTSYQIQALNDALVDITATKGKLIPVIDRDLVKQVFNDELRLERLN